MIFGEQAMACDYWLKPGHWGGRATRLVTVTYSHVERDPLSLCSACAEYVTQDARRHGYKVTNRPLSR